MRLKNPMQIRQLFAEKKGWATINQIAKGTGTDRKTVINGFKGRKVRSDVVQKWSAPLGLNAGEVATFVEN